MNTIKMLNTNVEIEELINRLHNGETFKDITECERGYIGDGIISHKSEPFETYMIHNLLRNRAYIERLISEVRDMEYYRKTTDLYNFEQSMDFHDQMDLGPYTRLFKELMDVKLKPLLENMYGFTCSHISITASRYKQKDYLLCHDDKCSDRYIAFIYYLCSDWKDSDGGLLCLYSHDEGTKEPTEIVRTIVPHMNDFLVFKVGTTTYHEVSEVTAKNKERYTINGWFHSPQALKEQPTCPLFDPVDPLLTVDSSNEPVMFAECFSPLYFRKTVMTGICEEYHKQSSVLLPNFLEQDFLNQCVNELSDPILKWKWIGPPNQRRYEVATFVHDSYQKLPENIGKLVKCLMAPNLFEYMECLTGVTLSGKEVSVDGKAFVLELQRWSGGCYSLLSDNNIQTAFNMLDLNLFLKVDDIGNDSLKMTEGQGSVAYSSDNVNVIGEPRCNSLFIVNNEENTGRYVKYINHLAHKKSYIYVVYMSSFCVKNTPSTSISSSVKEMLSSSGSVSINNTKYINKRRLDHCIKKLSKNKQRAKRKQNVTVKESITFGNVECKDKKFLTEKSVCKNIFLVSKNKKKVKRTVQNNSLTGKTCSSGNTFIVAETLDIHKKKRRGKPIS